MKGDLHHLCACAVFGSNSRPVCVTSFKKTVERPEEVEDELRYLLKVVGR